MENKNVDYITNTIEYNDYLLPDVAKSIIRHHFGILDTKWVDNIDTNFLDKSVNIFSKIALYYHRLLRYITTQQLLPLNTYSLREYMAFIEKITSIYISPFAIIEDDVILDGTHIFIYGDYHIKSKTTIFSGVCIGDKNYDENIYSILEYDNYMCDIDKKPYDIDKNCILNKNVKVAFCNIGEGCEICENAIVRENILDHSEVKIINQCQITKKEKSYIPSQELIIYGLVPKYKNTLTIYGDGIYNPKVIIRSGDKKIESQIEYWDKSKIILKLKGFLEKQNTLTSDQNLTPNADTKTMQKNTNIDKCIVVVMARGIKVSINDMGVIKKLLKNI